MNKKIKLKSVCWDCTTFNPSAKRSLKCACQKSCPGLNWSLESRNHLISTRNTLIKELKEVKSNGN